MEAMTQPFPSPSPDGLGMWRCYSASGWPSRGRWSRSITRCGVMLPIPLISEALERDIPRVQSWAMRWAERLPVIWWAMSRNPIEKRPNPPASARNTVFYANYACVLGDFAPKSDSTMHIFPIIRRVVTRVAKDGGKGKGLASVRCAFLVFVSSGASSHL